MSSTLAGTSGGRGFVYAGHMAIRPEPCGLSAARHQVMRVVDELSFNETDAHDVLLAVGEALSNAYRHGTADPGVNLIYLGWHFSGDILTLTVKDEGRGFVPYEAEPRDVSLRSARGCGIRLMRLSMDEVHFDWDDGAMVVLKKRVRPASRRARGGPTGVETGAYWRVHQPARRLTSS